MTRLLAVLAFILPASAAEIRIQHSVIKKILAEQVFTDEGRKYVKANRAAKCSYAYLENPDISSANGQLRIRARFTGRSAGDWFGRCIGLGDSFTAVIYATPYYAHGSIRLKDVRVDSEDADGFYIRRVRRSHNHYLGSNSREHHRPDVDRKGWHNPAGARERFGYEQHRANRGE